MASSLVKAELKAAVLNGPLEKVGSIAAVSPGEGPSDTQGTQPQIITLHPGVTLVTHYVIPTWHGVKNNVITELQDVLLSPCHSALLKPGLGPVSRSRNQKVLHTRAEEIILEDLEMGPSKTFSCDHVVMPGMLSCWEYGCYPGEAARPPNRTLCARIESGNAEHLPNYFH